MAKAKKRSVKRRIAFDPQDDIVVIFENVRRKTQYGFVQSEYIRQAIREKYARENSKEPMK